MEKNDMSKRRIFAGVFAVATLIVITLFISKNIDDSLSRATTVSTPTVPTTCTPFVVLAKMDTRIECVKGFIEIQEKDDGSTLVVCSCEDPLRCADERHLVKP